MKKLLLLLLLVVAVACEGNPAGPTDTQITININDDHGDDHHDDHSRPDPPIDNGDGNQPPTVVSPGDQDNLVGDSVALQIFASDPERDTLIWTATGLPRGLVISQTGLISGTPSPSSALDSPFTAATVIVADGNRNSSGVVFTWVVTDSSP